VDESRHRATPVVELPTMRPGGKLRGAYFGHLAYEVDDL